MWRGIISLSLGVGRQVPRGVKGHNANAIFLARILLATACPGSPFGMIRAVNSVERPRPVGGELHLGIFLFSYSFGRVKIRLADPVFNSKVTP